MDWLRLRKRAVEATFVTEYPTDARRSVEDDRTGEPDPDLELGRKLRRRVMVFILYTFFISGLIAAMFGRGGLLDLLRLHEDLGTARAELAEQQGRVQSLRRQVEQLRSDPAARERVAREELGLVKPGEVVFLLPRGEDDEEEPKATP
jgi:cell division protein FtsB